MRNFTLLLLTVVLSAAFSLSAAPPDQSWYTDPEQSWYTDFEKAQTEAREKNLPMFLLFTGSDWCPWCIKLSKDTLTTPEFKSFVKGKVVLVYLDFPRRRKLPKNLVVQNRKLQAEYGIGGYPTVIVTDPEGQKIGDLGYAKVKEFLPLLQQVLDRRKGAAPAAIPAVGNGKSESRMP